tara:strand:- start:134 stop:466 length:333 start_codon:yes stop_codon:yes gene_type:complete
MEPMDVRREFGILGRRMDRFSLLEGNPQERRRKDLHSLPSILLILERSVIVGLNPSGMSTDALATRNISMNGRPTEIDSGIKEVIPTLFHMVVCISKVTPGPQEESFVWT